MFFQTEDIFSCSKNASYYCRCTYLIELLSEQMVLLYFIAEWVRDKWALLLFCCIIVSNPATFFGTCFSTIVISPWDCISALFWFVNTSSLVPTVWLARSVLQSDWSHLISRNFGVLYLPRCYISSLCFFHKDGDIQTSNLFLFCLANEQNSCLRRASGKSQTKPSNCVLRKET